MTATSAWPRLTNFAELLRQLGEEKLPYRFFGDTSTVTLPTRLGREDGVIHLRWRADVGLVQFVHPVPMEAPANRIGELVAAANRINHGLMVLGFTVDERTGLCAFRTHAYLDPEGAVPTGLVGALIGTCAKSVADALPALREAAFPELSDELRAGILR